MCFIFHKWGRWGRLLSDGSEANLKMQFRECKECGKIDARKMSINYANLSDALESLDENTSKKVGE